MSRLVSSSSLPSSCCYILQCVYIPAVVLLAVTRAAHMGALHVCRRAAAIALSTWVNRLEVGVYPMSEGHVAIENVSTLRVYFFCVNYFPKFSDFSCLRAMFAARRV